MSDACSSDVPVASVRSSSVGRRTLGDRTLGRPDWPVEILRSQTRSVSIAKTHSDIRAIARLRYELYIARDRKPYGSADHDRRLFIDAIDDVSLNFQANRDDVLLAAVRLTMARDALRDPQTALVIKAADTTNLAKTSVTSRLAVRPIMSARRVIVPMFQEIYRCGLVIGIEHSLLATRLELRGIFERFGFRMTGRSFDDPVAGTLHVLRLDLIDRAYLVQINSPLIEKTGDCVDGNS